ncbi:6-phosphofructokinase subunit alpha [Ascoidea rubescens DSM 1968]|uniref:ATP-dependent 6-phosphofructokinase n=1 Tax=Ascoidea rubescens DSM 1968 TaxID=1344418 RepID=A0A1D2VPR3_9ASCO|nr:6-phosphofructokinase [Ascoidea rubescens DSM 1968]ODV63601.1 6-phosphofructokinase [Ascoidea rubescens DSM 1968]
MTVSLLTDLSYVSLTTSSLDRYEKTIQFYRSIGYQIARNFTKDPANSSLTNDSIHSNKIGISNDSFKESWLECFSSSTNSSGSAIKIRLSATSANLKVSTNQISITDSSGSNAVIDAPKSIFLNINDVSLEKIKKTLIDQKSPIDTNFNDYEKTLSIFKNLSFKTTDPLNNSVFFSLVNFNDNNHNNIYNDSKAFSSSFKSHSSLTLTTHLAFSRKKKKIAIMTSGGDSQGMNAVVRSVVRTGIFYNCDVYAIYEGYEGLVNGNNSIKKMSWNDVRGFISFGGTLIGTARSNAFRTPEGRLKACYNMIINGIDALIVCGGDGSLTGADLFRHEWPSLCDKLIKQKRLSIDQVNPFRNLTIVGLVGSIDNDMSSTDSTIGAYSSLERICEMVDYIDATATSHSRAFVVEVMGRHCGWLALMAGIATGADFIFIPERPPNSKTWKDDLKEICLRHRQKGRRKTTVIVAEGAIDNQLNPISADEVKDALVELGLDTRITTLGHVQRGGSPVAFDRMLATFQGVEAVKAVLDSTPSTPSPMIGILENQIIRKPLVESVRLTKSVATAIENKEFDKAMSLRDTEFGESYNSFLATSIHDDGSTLLPENKRLNFAVIHVGAPTAGINPATRAITLFSLSRGHKVFAIQNGFKGLIRHGSIRELNWLDVDEWHNLGGSVIGTNRSLPSEDFGTVAYYLQKYKIDGFIIIGGFEAFESLHLLYNSRNQYPIFNIPMLVIPSTISNNVPGSEYSLGNDTCLNSLITYCDAIKQSASASRRRVFVVEVQGGYCGYVASYAGLVTGALAVYLPEKDVNLRSIQEDIDLLKANYKRDRGENRAGKILIRNEKCSKIFTTDLITDIIMESAHGSFESRCAIPGHVQQGKTPSSMDRVYATRFAVRAVKYIEAWNEKINKTEGFLGDDTDPNLRFQYVHGVKKPIIDDLDESASVIGTKGSELKFTPISEILPEVDFERRTHKNVWWEKFNEIGDTLSGRAMLRREEDDDDDDVEDY